MKRLFSAVFALMMVLGLAVTPVAAQTAAEEDALDEVGVESGYTRLYQTEDTSSEVLIKMVGGIKFSDTEVVQDGLSEFACGFVGGFTGSTDAAGCEDLEDAGWTIEERDDLGESAVEATGTAQISGQELPATMLFVLEGDYVFIVADLGVAEAGSVDEMGQFLVDAEPSDTEVEFDASGTSTGGFFDMLPAEGDELIEGYAPAQDIELYSPSTGTPGN